MIREKAGTKINYDINGGPLRNFCLVFGVLVHPAVNVLNSRSKGCGFETEYCLSSSLSTRINYNNRCEKFSRSDKNIPSFTRLVKTSLLLYAYLTLSKTANGLSSGIVSLLHAFGYILAVSYTHLTLPTIYSV